MCKLNVKRGYRRYVDFNHNRLVVLVKGWYKEKLMCDMYYNEQYLGYVTTEASWADLFNSDTSDSLINSLMQEDVKLSEYSPAVLKMKLSEENILFECSPFNLYVTIPYRQRATLKICNPNDFNEQVVLQDRQLQYGSYKEVFDECQNYMKALEDLVDELMQ